MAQTITAFSVVEVCVCVCEREIKITVTFQLQVGKPKVGENCPSRVRADVTIHLAVKDPVRVEWESRLRTKVTVFLCHACDVWGALV